MRLNYSLISLIAGIALSGCGSQAHKNAFQGLDQLPPPKTEFAVREYPGPALNPADDGAIVQAASCSFMFLRNGKVVSGNIMLNGTVAEVLPGKVLVKDSSDVVTSFVYILPDSMSLPLTTGDPVTIFFSRDAEWVNAFSIEILKNARPLYAGCRAFGTTPIKAVLASKMYIRQKENSPAGLVPVLVGYGGKEVPVDDKGAALLSIAGIDYRTQILVSLLREKDTVGSSGQEGLPYTLEYYAFPNSKDASPGK